MDLLGTFEVCVFWLWYFVKQFADLSSYGVLMFWCLLLQQMVVHMKELTSNKNIQIRIIHEMTTNSDLNLFIKDG